MIGVRTEKAIKAVIAKGSQVSYRMEIRKNGNHAISFFDADTGVDLAKFTLRQIVEKRLAKTKVK